MKQRSLITVVLLTIFTFGIYTIVWFVKTKGELNARGAQIPTAWLMIIPFVNVYWLWRYFEGAEQVTNGQSNALLNLLLSILISSIIPQLMLQNEYNKLAGTPAIPTAPAVDTAAPAAVVNPAPAPEAPANQPTDTTPPTNPPAGPQPPLVQ